MLKQLTALALTGSLALSALAFPAAAAGAPSASGLQGRLDQLTSRDGFAGALGYVSDASGRTVTLKSGTAQRGTGKPMIGPEGRFRIASMSKSIMAATVLRLVSMDKIDLDAPVERYLPGVVHGTGAGAAIDGSKITIRMLLQQTSGLPEFADAIDWNRPMPDYLKVALARKPSQRGKFAYANTNYLVLGKVVTAVTGKDFRVASRDLILKPYGMRDSYWPAKGDNDVRGPHAHTYGVHPAHPDKGVVDLTAQLPTYEWGPSGGLVSSPADLNRFWRQAPRALDSSAAVPVNQPGWPAGARYVFGVTRAKFSCGTVSFHGGDMPGASVISGRDRAGRTASVYVTAIAASPKLREHLLAAFEAAICTR